MKKFIITALAAVLAFDSCMLLDDPVYTLTNAAAYLNYKDNTLFTDGGTTFNVTADNTDGKWKTDGSRFYAIFDVLNVDYDITLKTYVKASIVTPVKDAEPQNAPGDPVSVMDCNISGGYLNLLLDIYVKKGSDTAHDMNLYWSDDSRTMTFILVHEGNGESILDLPESDMEVATRCFSFPIYNLADEGESRMIELTINALVKNDDGTYTGEPFTYSVFSNAVTF